MKNQLQTADVKLEVRGKSGQFGSVIIDDVYQCQTAMEEFSPGCLCTLSVNCEKHLAELQ